MSSVLDIKSYSPNKTDQFFIDANILFYLYCPLGDYPKNIIDEYSVFIKKVINSGSKIFISSLVLSEFINRFGRLEFELWKSTIGNPRKDYNRDFKKSNEFKTCMRLVKKIIQKQILSYITLIDDEISNLNISAILSDIDKIDFNDRYYIALAILKNLKIITHDKGISKFPCPVTVITNIR